MLSRLHVYALPKFADPESLAGGTVVVIDVLRAATTIIYALQAGAKAVIPCREIDEAHRIAARFSPNKKILGGERGGLPIEGFDLGNSPEQYTPDRVRGKTVVFTTTNGTQALLHARKAHKILLGAFVNASAVVQKLLGQETIHLLCAGTDGQSSEDDILLAGMLAEKLQRQGGMQCKLNDQAIAARELWRHTLEIARASAAQLPKPEPLAKILRHSLGGQNLVAVGLEKDILAAAQIDRFAIVPQFNPETSRIQVIK
ncbi:MAG: 2-phosphosulfolactate phosphatase [Thermoguttaceae bacterium]|jgi:2-phosphosulfolactate phosphatase